ncbi:MAG: hypothetical protein QXI11_01990 [Thermoproteota archaeon]
MSLTINVDIKEIYKIVCDECKKKIREYIQKKISEQLAEKVLEGGG